VKKVPPLPWARSGREGREPLIQALKDEDEGVQRLSRGTGADDLEEGLKSVPGGMPTILPLFCKGHIRFRSPKVS